jgi:hypothetical protein
MIAPDAWLARQGTVFSRNKCETEAQCGRQFRAQNRSRIASSLACLLSYRHGVFCFRDRCIEQPHSLAWARAITENQMRVQDGSFPLNRVIEKLPTSDKVTLTIERVTEGKMRVTSSGWADEKVLPPDQVLSSATSAAGSTSPEKRDTRTNGTGRSSPMTPTGPAIPRMTSPILLRDCDGSRRTRDGSR